MNKRTINIKQKAYLILTNIEKNEYYILLTIKYGISNYYMKKHRTLIF